MGGLVFYLGGIYLVEEFDLFPQIYPIRFVIFVPAAVLVMIGTTYILNQVINNFQTDIREIVTSSQYSSGG